jgi:hypothetical protein
MRYSKKKISAKAGVAVKMEMDVECRAKDGALNALVCLPNDLL